MNDDNGNEGECFGLEKQDLIWKGYCGQWMLFKIHGNTEVGRLNRITSDYLILNPHQGLTLKDGRLSNEIVYRDSGIPLRSEFLYRVISEEEVNAVCKEMNKDKEPKKN